MSTAAPSTGHPGEILYEWQRAREYFPDICRSVGGVRVSAGGSWPSAALHVAVKRNADGIAETCFCFPFAKPHLVHAPTFRDG